MVSEELVNKVVNEILDQMGEDELPDTRLRMTGHSYTGTYLNELGCEKYMIDEDVYEGHETRYREWIIQPYANLSCDETEIIILCAEHDMTSSKVTKTLASRILNGTGFQDIRVGPDVEPEGYDVAVVYSCGNVVFKHETENGFDASTTCPNCSDGKLDEVLTK